MESSCPYYHSDHNSARAFNWLRKRSELLQLEWVIQLRLLWFYPDMISLTAFSSAFDLSSKIPRSFLRWAESLSSAFRDSTICLRTSSGATPPLSVLISTLL